MLPFGNIPKLPSIFPGCGEAQLVKSERTPLDLVTDQAVRLSPEPVDRGV